MTLYHFCSRHHLDDIQREGITLGRLVWRWERPNPPEYVGPLQWLTRNPDFKAQGWCSTAEQGSRLPYCRNDYRLTIELPEELRENAIDWRVYCDMHHPPLAETLNAAPGWMDWVIYDGMIPIECVKKIDRHPEFNTLAQSNPQAAWALKRSAIARLKTLIS
jgi:hypothetical protein